MDFVSKVISLLFNMLSKFVIAFLPRSNLLISCLQSPSAVILEAKKIKFITLSIVFRGEGPCSIPDWGAKIPHAARHSQKKKEKKT